MTELLGNLILRQHHAVPLFGRTRHRHRLARQRRIVLALHARVKIIHIEVYEQTHLICLPYVLYHGMLRSSIFRTNFL